jgi:hypothetical protein
LFRTGSEPSIEFSRVPPSGGGDPDKLEAIEGRVRGARSGQRIVLFAFSGVWWVQPLVDRPFTQIQNDSTWRNQTHPGAAYAALLVDARYRPPVTVSALPKRGGSVLAVATVTGAVAKSQPRMLQFSGYQWEIRQTPGAHGATSDLNDPANAWTDQSGFLHLRVDRRGERWVGAEVKLSRSLGYGSYRVVVRDVTALDPAAVFAVFTWDDSGPPREMDIEVSRWGEPEEKNAQYVIQPYVVPANTIRFVAPSGMLTHSMSWEPGRVSFKTLRGSPARAVGEHVFTSGVPSPGNERVHMNVYVYQNRRNPLRRGFEVVVEKFEFLP